MNTKACLALQWMPLDVVSVPHMLLNSSQVAREEVT